MRGVEESFQRGKDWLVVHKHAAWLCLAASFCAGLVWGFLIAVLIIVL